MQSTNYKYGLPYLATCHVTFTFISCNSEKKARIVRCKRAIERIKVRFARYILAIVRKRLPSLYLVIMTLFLAIGSLYPAILRCKLTIAR